MPPEADPKPIRRHSRKAFSPPGTLTHIGEVALQDVAITRIAYDGDAFYDEKDLQQISECLPDPARPCVLWINIVGLHKPDIIETIGKIFDIHPLTLEDILHTGQRPKFDDYGHYAYINLRNLDRTDSNSQFEPEQISLIVGKSYVISFQERAGPVFDPIRQRLRENRGRIRKSDSDYLGYALLDVVVDRYFLLLESLSDEVQALEDRVAAEEADTVQAIQRVKNRLLVMRKAIWPLRDIMSQLEKGSCPIFRKQTLTYLRDVYDHTVQVIETVEIFREMTTELLQLHFANASVRMNEVMKVLTIIATIFIPLTFIVGVYGMNFEFQPEYHWQYGYPAIWIVMLLITGGMVAFFRRMRWF